MSRLPDTAELRHRISLADAALADRFWNGEDVDLLVAERARFIDAFLAEIWQHWFEYRSDIALLALGGYGRGELHPQSDIDLLILVSRARTGSEEIAAFVRFLWDLNLDIGHSVRTVRDCVREAARDITVITSLYERRRLTGSEVLCGKLDRALGRRRIWPSRAFFAAKRNEQAQRHAQFDDVEYNLEPNIKGGPGGLRDIQTIGWITERHLGTSHLSELTRHGYLTPQERTWLVDGRRFLFRVRFGLHLVAERKEDRLLFDHQRALAQRFGYRDSDAQLAVEQFMHDYYRHVLALREVNDMLLQHFDEAILRARERPRVEQINERFQLRNDYIETTSPQVFREDPAALIEIFLVMAHRPDIAGVRAETVRCIRDNLELIDDDFHRNAKATAYFLELLRSPNAQLSRMRRYGVLGRYIPEFGRIVGQMQHDLFHIYTVDAHTIMVTENLRRLRDGSTNERFPLATQCAQNVPRVELLYLAGLFHDISKGRGGDHSELGAVDAIAFCQRHGLDPDDTELVGWLVRDHLVMSTTAQREDIYDAVVVEAFAERVGTQTRLDYLYALTVADITATNPSLWNSWRATLMNQLYAETRLALAPGVTPQPEDRVARRTARALETLAQRGIHRDEALALWDDPTNEFFLRHTAMQIADITAAMHHHDVLSGPLVILLDLHAPGREEGVTEVFVYTPDRPKLFAASAVALDQLNLQVHDASINTSAGGLCFNSYIVLDEHGRSLRQDDARRRRIRTVLAGALADPNPDPEGPTRHVSRRLKQFVTPTEATMSTEPGWDHSVLTVVTSDRPGLLARLGLLFVELGLSVQRAHITTLGERVEDMFQIANVPEPANAERICAAIRNRLDAAHGALSAAHQDAVDVEEQDQQRSNFDESTPRAAGEMPALPYASAVREDPSAEGS